MNVSTSDLYAILGVSPNADDESIRAAFRAAARRFHPDSNPNTGAGHQFASIAAAYEILGDDYRRAEYDRQVRQKGLPPAYFELKLTPSRRVLRAISEPQVLYVLLEIEPAPRFAKQQAQETPLNLALVIDRSTSMRGNRLDRVKTAVHRIIDSLSEHDRLAVVSFSDRAEIVFESTPVVEKNALKAIVSTMAASGGTEIYQGLASGVEQVRRFAGRDFVNHVILLTDGQTYGDEDQCLELADALYHEGIGVSAIGIGEEWNDAFLDELASRTGGASTYIKAPSAVDKFLDNKIRSLSAAFAERLQLSVAPDPDMRLEDAFKLYPNAQQLPVDSPTIPLGGLERHRRIGLLLQLQLPPLSSPGRRTAMRIDVTADLLREEFESYRAIADFKITVAEEAPPENPPPPILEALGKLTLHRMQLKAQDAIAKGNFREATRRLENLATRLLENGEEALAHAALAEARRVARTSMLSEEGQKDLKYGTRALLTAGLESDSSTRLIGNESDE